jgi:hypothetical protein
MHHDSMNRVLVIPHLVPLSDGLHVFAHRHDIP